MSPAAHSMFGHGGPDLTFSTAGRGGCQAQGSKIYGGRLRTVDQLWPLAFRRNTAGYGQTARGWVKVFGLRLRRLWTAAGKQCQLGLRIVSLSAHSTAKKDMRNLSHDELVGKEPMSLSAERPPLLSLVTTCVPGILPSCHVPGTETSPVGGQGGASSTDILECFEV